MQYSLSCKVQISSHGFSESNQSLCFSFGCLPEVSKRKQIKKRLKLTQKECVYAFVGVPSYCVQQLLKLPRFLQPWSISLAFILLASTWWCSWFPKSSMGTAANISHLDDSFATSHLSCSCQFWCLTIFMVCYFSLCVQGLRLELCTGDRVGLLSDMTRIFLENGLSVTRADVSTQGDKAINVFYVTDPSGDPVDKTVERIRRNYPILGVKEMSSISESPQVKEQASSPLSSFLKSSERFFQGLTTGWKMSTVA